MVYAILKKWKKIFIKWYSNFSLLSRRQTPFFLFERFLIQSLKAKVKVITMADPREGKHQKKLNSDGHVIGYSFVFDWFVGCCKNFLANKKTEQSKSLEIK